MRGTTIRPAIEEMLMIIPSCCARMIGTTARRAAAAASTLSVNTASTSALDASPMGAVMPMPALFTRMSMPPSWRIVSCASCSTAPVAVTSVGMTIAEPPSALIDAASSSKAWRFRAATASRAPRRANSTAIARPMHCEAPVTMTRALLNFTPPPLGEGQGGGSMLAAATEVGRLTSGSELGDAVATARTLLLSFGVDLHEAAVLLVGLVLRLRLDRLDRFAQHFSGRGVKAHHLIGLEGRPLP